MVEEAKPLYYPNGPSEGFFKDKNSKFYGFLYRVEYEEEVKEILKKLHKDFYDSRHIAYAYRIGFEEIIFKANDAGEPNYSAGAPIYRRIVAHKLSNILIAVVRYFGGTKLGVSGLIQAYETAAENAILNAQKVVYTPSIMLSVSLKISNSYILYKVCEEYNAIIKTEVYGEEHATFTIKCDKEKAERFQKDLLMVGASISIVLQQRRDSNSD